MAGCPMAANRLAVAYDTVSVCDWPSRISGAYPMVNAAGFSIAVARASTSRKSGPDTRARGFEPSVSLANTDTTRSSSSTGRPRSSAKSANVKPMVDPAMAAPRVNTISADVPGARRMARTADFKSAESSNHMGTLLG